MDFGLDYLQFAYSLINQKNILLVITVDKDINVVLFVFLFVHNYRKRVIRN